MSPLSHSTSVALQQREIVRIHELWQKAKAELRSKAAELAELKDRLIVSDSTNLRAEAQLDDYSHVQLENVKLKEQLRTTETELER